MTTLSKTFKNEYSINNYDVWTTVCSMDIDGQSAIVDTPMTDSEGEKPEATTLHLADGSEAVTTGRDVETY